MLFSFIISLVYLCLLSFTLSLWHYSCNFCGIFVQHIVLPCEKICATFHPAGTEEVNRCMFSSSFTHLPTTTATPITPHTRIHTHTRTEVARVQSRVHKDPSELNMLASFQWISHLSCKAHNRAESPCPSYLVHPPTHTWAHISKKQGLIYRSALQNNQSSPAQVY